MLCFISNAASTAVRIGHTSNPYALMVRLLAVHGDDLRLLSVINGGSAADAFLQALFAADHIEDGWFKPSALLSALIEHLTAAAYDDDEVDWVLSLACMVKVPAKVEVDDAKPPKIPGRDTRFRKASEYADAARAKAYEEALSRAAARQRTGRKAA
jgi:hypothetical protein